MEMENLYFEDEKVQDILKNIKNQKEYLNQDDLKNKLKNILRKKTDEEIQFLIKPIIKKNKNLEEIVYLKDLENLLKSLPVYDLIIDTKSILKLNDGWDILYNGDYKNERRVKEALKNDNILTAVIGNSNRGKTYLLRKIANIESIRLASSHAMQTKGISIKIPKNIKNLILIDSFGGNAPMILEKNDKEFMGELDEKYKKIKNAEIVTNYLIQNFIINEASILICVVGLLTSEEQKYMHKIRNQCLNRESEKNLVIIHNLYMLNSIEEINDYIEHILKKSLTFKLIEVKDTIFKGFNNEYFINDNYDAEKLEKKNEIYFIEEFDGNKKEIKHFIYMNENIKNAEYYNSLTINSIIKFINHEGKFDSFDVVEKFRKFIIYKSKEVFNENLDDNDLYIDHSKLKSAKKITAKELKIDILDTINIIEKDSIPYCYYIYDKYLIIEIQVNSEIKDFNINYKIIENQIKFEIKGIKLLFNDEIEKDKIICKEFEGNRKELIIDIKFSMNRRNISYFKKKGEELINGSYTIIYEIIYSLYN